MIHGQSLRIRKTNSQLGDERSDDREEAAATVAAVAAAKTTLRKPKDQSVGRSVVICQRADGPRGI